jgi:hypothetical protein
MENVSAIQSGSRPWPKCGLHHKANHLRRTAMEAPSILGWYRILRAHYHWPLFQAIRYALWLAR